MLYNRHDAEPLKLLPYTPNASFNASGKENDPFCLPNTRVDLLRGIYSWADGEDKRHIFWLSGWAGTGKSTIARTVAREHYKRKYLVASYFFSRGGGDTSRATKFVGTIATQIAHKSPEFKSLLQNTVSQDGGIVQRVLRDQWRELIVAPLSRLGADSVKSPIIIVVDALDECEKESDIRQVLQLLADTEDLDRRHIRILITSRPDMPIQDGFKQLSDSYYQNCVLHDISDEVVDDDIRHFLEHQLKHIRPKEQDIAQLVKNAAGLFIWAATACRFVGKGPSAKTRLPIVLGRSTSTLTPNEYVYGIYIAHLQEAIKIVLWNVCVLYFWAAISCGFVREGLSFKQWLYSFLMSDTISPESHLDWIYLTVLNRSLDPDSNPGSIAPSPQEIRDCAGTIRHVLGGIVVLFSPLSMQSVCSLLLIPEEKGDNNNNDKDTGKEEIEKKGEEVKQMLESLYAILDIPEDKTCALRLHHPSFRDFLLKKERCYDTYLWVDEKQAHQVLADGCIRLMSTSLKEDICKLDAPGVLVVEVDNSRVEQHLPPEVQYACLYWVEHLQKSSVQLHDNDQVHRFLQTHFLHWLEALSWMRRLSEGILAIRSLESIALVRLSQHVEKYAANLLSRHATVPNYAPSSMT